MVPPRTSPLSSTGFFREMNFGQELSHVGWQGKRSIYEFWSKEWAIDLSF